MKAEQQDHQIVPIEQSDQLEHLREWDLEQQLVPVLLYDKEGQELNGGE